VSAYDQILISGLQARAIIGVHAWEQHQPRPLLIDVELGMDARAAAATDRLRDAVDYKAVSDEIIAFAASREFRLIETLAESLARLLFERHPIHSLRMTIHKPGAVPEARGVAVRIDRRREDYAVCGRAGI
jgi:dihydroneopterin aldolase